MSLKYKIIKEQKLVYVVGEGTLTYEDLVDHLTELSGNPAYIPPMLKLIDYRNLSHITLTSKQSEKLAELKYFYRNQFDKEKSALVVSSDLVFGIGRQHQAYMYDSKMEVEIFKDFEKAKEWLGIQINEAQLALS